MGGLDEVMARRSCLWGKRLLRASRFFEGEAVAKKPERSSKYQSHHDGLFRAAFNRPDALKCEAEVVLPVPVGMEATHAEVTLSRYRRLFTLSKELDADKVGAELAQGVLRVRIPKADHAQPRKISVQVK